MACVLNRLQNIIDAVKDNETYKKAVAAEVSKYAESKFSFQRFSIQKSQNVRYEYKGDYVWNDLNAKIKARETFLKTITEPTFDGEGIQVMPAIKKSIDTLTIKPLE
jgi:hypothetical protein